jgi:hypothetical protein
MSEDLHEQQQLVGEECDLYPSITTAELNQAAWLVGAEVLPQRAYGAAGKNVMVKAICLAVKARRQGQTGLPSGEIVSGEAAQEPHAFLIDFVRKASRDHPDFAD